MQHRAEIRRWQLRSGRQTARAQYVTNQEMIAMALREQNDYRAHYTERLNVMRALEVELDSYSETAEERTRRTDHVRRPSTCHSQRARPASSRIGQ
jgi:hypothetical protein